ncbi:hypothetical protein [Salsipaludibacter albus]|uniref:hypothetical protein n=1 Tax=Salsipaludibacter albus TaxID=2849650 RepID=UPI001EE46067|nr:hypothetical protein [Salsipaludibacter albus]MBY5162100.1 hypothetical protein [Salsipaludibacter albus]
MGRPTKDPILEVVEAWWGRDLPEFVRWAASSGPLHARAAALAHEGPWTRFDAPPVPTEDEVVEWHGGTDGLHLSRHCQSPLEGETTGRQREFKPDGDSRQRVLLVDAYAGWYRRLTKVSPDRTPDDRSVRVDVVCKPIGWLGTYRRSKETGGWFRGRHRWHVLGA